MSLPRWPLRRPGAVLLLLAATVVSLPAAENAVKTREVESEARLKRDIFYIASPECEGRGPTTKGLDRAADYIAGEFRKAGLKSASPDGGYFQPFTVDGA